MHHNQGENRNQLFMFSYEQVVAPDSFVRVIDAFVDILDLKSFGFSHIDTHEEGRPPYHPGVLLKLYLYGYHYGIRSSRKLEREARLNMEVNWLLHGQHPKNRTISEFRKIHPKAFKEVFRRFVYLLKQWDFIEGETIAIDSFKVRACNSLKNNFNDRKLIQHIEYIDNKIAEYEDALNEAEDEEKQDIEKKIEQKNQQKEKYQNIKQQLSEQNQEQISLTDPDARAVVLHRNIINVGYNRVSENPDYYRLRQQIAEHMFGTFKRQRGFTYTLMKGKENVLSEVRLVFLTYNIGRIARILGVRELVERLKDSISLNFGKIRSISSRFHPGNLKHRKNKSRLTIPLNGFRWVFSENML